MGTDNQNSQEETQAQEKTFSQAELDAVVKDRLKREREKYADFDALKEKAAKFDEIEQANKSELEKANEQVNALKAELDGIKKAEQLREMRTKIATENNVPVELLTGATEEECQTQVEKIKEMMLANGIPTAVRDGGEATHSGKVSSGTLFANWAKDKL